MIRNEKTAYFSKTEGCAVRHRYIHLFLCPDNLYGIAHRFRAEHFDGNECLTAVIHVSCHRGDCKPRSIHGRYEEMMEDLYDAGLFCIPVDFLCYSVL